MLTQVPAQLNMSNSSDMLDLDLTFLQPHFHSITCFSPKSLVIYLGT